MPTLPLWRAVPVAILLLGCKSEIPLISEPLTEDFERADLGAFWHNTGAGYRIKDGKVNVSMAHNHPLWLRKRLPADVVIEVDAMSKSPDGDLKIELYGDGETFDPDGNDYTPSGYVLFFGGHRNSESIIGRLGEHGDAVKAHNRGPVVEPGRVYHWTITRKGGLIDWKVDGKPFLSWTDPQPLGGTGHEYFAINNWETDVYFDNLRIRPLR